MFENISDKDLYQIYQELWENKILPGEVINTWWNHGDDSRDSKNSYQFLIPNVNYKKITRKDVNCIRSEIKRIFQIKSPSFTKQFEDACCGDGKEYKEIMRLHSSALCALLFFCEVRKNNKLCLEINGKQYSFYEAMFEYKNKVITRASNVDIVLIGENISTGNNAILFLESKFSEYVISKNQKSEFNEIGIDYFKKYNDIYNDSVLNAIGLEMKKNNESSDGFCGIKTINKEKTYLEGLKQMISHYIGVRHFINKDFEDTRKIEEFKEMNMDKTEIFLGEVMFDFDFAHEEFDKYSNYYNRLAGQLNLLNPKIHVINNIIRYKSILAKTNYHLSPEVRSFYAKKT